MACSFRVRRECGIGMAWHRVGLRDRQNLLTRGMQDLKILSRLGLNLGYVATVMNIGNRRVVAAPPSTAVESQSVFCFT